MFVKIITQNISRCTQLFMLKSSKLSRVCKLTDTA